MTTKVRVPPQQHQISSQFSKELKETKLRDEKFSIHVRFRVSDDGIEWLMMLQEKRRKLPCDVKVIKAEEWRTNKSTFKIENVERKNLHTKFSWWTKHGTDVGKCVLMMMENNFTLKSEVEERRPEWMPINPFEITTILFTSQIRNMLLLWDGGEREGRRGRYDFFMGTRVGPFVGHTSGFGYENKNICTYITRDKNTLGRLHQHRRTETCFRVLGDGKRFATFDEGWTFHPLLFALATLFISSRSICCFCFVLVFSHEIFCTIRYLCSLLV